MTEKWTPGPWRVARNKHNRAVAPWTGAIGIEAPEDEGGMLAIPSIVAWTTRGCPSANARLISAAPELYEALDRLLIVAYSEAYKSDDDRIAEAMAAAALAKARGEVPR